MKNILFLNIILLSLGSTTSLIYSNAFEKECMPGKTLSELWEEYHAGWSAFFESDECKNMKERTDTCIEQIVSKRSERAIADKNAWDARDDQEKCQKYRVQINQLSNELNIALEVERYIKKQRKKQHSQFKKASAELYNCIMEREYKNISIASAGTK